VKEYGNVICFASENETPTQTELDVVTRMLEHNFLQHAAEYDFPVDAQPEILHSDPEKVMAPFFKETGEPFKGDLSFGYPKGIELRWNGKYYHYFAWRYVLESD
jgi:hypothetical protein